MDVPYDHMDAPKIGIITSRGGHLYQMFRLRPWWKTYSRFWVTFPGEDVVSMLKNERIYYAHYPESRNIINALRNIGIAVRVIVKEKPTLLISCGAGIAPPFFYIGKLFGVRLVFIEPFDFVRYPSVSGKLVEPIVDVLLVQSRRQLAFYKRGKYTGATL